MNEIAPKRRKIPAVFKTLLIFCISIAIIIFFFHLILNMLLGDLANINTPIDKFTQNQEDSQLDLGDIRLITETTDDPSIGSEHAPIVIVEYLDFGCSYCNQSHEVIKKIQKQYSQEVKFIFRDFPVEALHPGAMSAAKAANCAHKQKKYVEMSDYLFSLQGQLQDVDYDIVAKHIGLDTELFQTCFNSKFTETEVLSDQKDALALGVNKTPIFFLNGSKVEGAITYDFFERIIDMTLLKLK